MSENTSRKRSRGRTGIYNAFRSSLSSSLSLTVVLYGLVISLTYPIDCFFRVVWRYEYDFIQVCFAFFLDDSSFDDKSFLGILPLFAVGSALVPLPQVCKLGLCEGVCAAAPSDY